jgi:hypothetical protein
LQSIKVKDVKSNQKETKYDEKYGDSLAVFATAAMVARIMLPTC